MTFGPAEAMLKSAVRVMMLAVLVAAMLAPTGAAVGTAAYPPTGAKGTPRSRTQ